MDRSRFRDGFWGLLVVSGGFLQIQESCFLGLLDSGPLFVYYND